MDDIIIRKFEILDISGISDLSKNNVYCKKEIELIAKSFMHSENTKNNCYVAVIGDRIIGFIYGFLIDNGTLYPQFLYVEPTYRKKGIGKGLMDAIEKGTACNTSIIVYHKSLHDYYVKQGYLQGDQLEVAIKEISRNMESR